MKATYIVERAPRELKVGDFISRYGSPPSWVPKEFHGYWFDLAARGHEPLKNEIFVLLRQAGMSSGVIRQTLAHALFLEVAWREKRLKEELRTRLADLRNVEAFKYSDDPVAPIKTTELVRGHPNLIVSESPVRLASKTTGSPWTEYQLANPSDLSRFRSHLIVAVTDYVHRSDKGATFAIQFYMSGWADGAPVVHAKGLPNMPVTYWIGKQLLFTERTPIDELVVFVKARWGMISEHYLNVPLEDPRAVCIMRIRKVSSHTIPKITRNIINDSGSVKDPAGLANNAAESISQILRWLPAEPFSLNGCGMNAIFNLANGVEVSFNSITGEFEVSAPSFRFGLKFYGIEKVAHGICERKISWAEGSGKEFLFISQIVEGHWVFCLKQKNINNVKYMPKPKVRSEKELPFVTYDLETFPKPRARGGHDWVPFAFSLYDGTKSTTFFLWEDGGDVRAFMRRCVSFIFENYKGYTVFAHNGSRFDHLFLLDAIAELCASTSIIMKDNSLLAVDCEFGKDKAAQVRFRDSIRLFDRSLRLVCKSFGVEQQKLHYPHKFMWEVMQSGGWEYLGTKPAFSYYTGNLVASNDLSREEWESIPSENWSFKDATRVYVEADCVSLYQALKKARETFNERFPRLDFLGALSAPSYAFKVFRTYYLKDHKIPILNGIYDDFARMAYYGGFVNVYKPVVNNAKQYDANSLYATAMQGAIEGLPVGAPRWVFEPDIFAPGTEGIVVGTVRVREDLRYPVLPTRIDGKLVAAVGELKGAWHLSEIRNAIKLGQLSHYEFPVGLIFDSSRDVFKEYIESNIKMRMEAKEKGQAALDYLAKLLNNSLYGRFGMAETYLECRILTQDEFSELSLKTSVQSSMTLPSGKEIVSYDPEIRRLLAKAKLQFDAYRMVDEMDEVMEAQRPTFKRLVNAAMAGAITANSRILMQQLMNSTHMNQLGCAYSDTDSFVAEFDLPADQVGKKLGQFKKEHDISHGVYAGQKLYATECKAEDGTTYWNNRNKGYKGTFDFEQIKTIYSGGEVTVPITKWYRNAMAGTLYFRDQQVTFHRILNKRQPIFDEKGNWVNTIPLLIKDGQPVQRTYPILPFDCMSVPRPTVLRP